MGGHGTEIIIRGQSQDRLAVINDGAFTFGGCPNRMDPPASTALLESADVITVRRGYQTVTEGPPAPGGTVLLDRVTPAFAEPGVDVSLTAGGETNGNLRHAAGTVTAGAKGGYGRAFYGLRSADNYEDGAGRDIRSAFDQKGGGVEIGWAYAPGSVARVAAERDEVTDALFAGAGMDSPMGVTTTYRAEIRHEVMSGGPLSVVEASIYTSLVDHLMDNYSLRPVTATMKMATHSDSNTRGGRLAAGFVLGDSDLTVGVDHRTNARDAILYSGMAALPGAPTGIGGLMWPDMRVSDTAVFGEMETPLSAATRLTAGARIDHVRAKAVKADVDPTGAAPAARALHATYYGTTDTSAEEWNLSGLVRLDHGFGGGLNGWVGASRAVRTADASERGIARNAGANSWVGDPSIDPEKHYQIDAGLQARGDSWTTGVGAWGDWVNDFITRDTARGQEGVLQTNGASIYRNVDAIIAGVEVEGEWRPWTEIRLGADAVYTWGANTSDSRPLYQIPPLQGAVEAAWEPGDWGLGTRMRWALTQTRADINAAGGSGLDPRETPGYAVFDLFGSYTGIDGLTLRAGVTNLLDQTYASHLSRSNSVDPQLVQVNEPGRSVYLQGMLRF